MIVPVENRKAAEAMGELMNYIRNGNGIVVQPDSIENKSGRLNNAAAQFVSWKGNNKNGLVEIHYVIFFVSAHDEPWLAAYLGSPDVLNKQRRSIERMVESVKRIPPHARK